ncbi:MAG: XRE family transcriptional regulator [bacterium]|nr:XRE family transcriptional regulator [bacterium]
MIGQRIKQLRLARGLSQDGLTAKMGDLVTKSAISKYEKGRSTPSIIVINKLAAALGVKSVDLWAEPAVAISLTQYRCRARMPAKERVRVESIIAVALEERVRLQSLVQDSGTFDLPIHFYPADEFDAVEEAAGQVRDRWNLGQDPIPSMVRTLEDHGVYVIELDACEHFDALAAIASDSDGGQPVAAAVITQKTVPGDRQRFSLAHELGHLVMKTREGTDEKSVEAVAHRFAGAFLAPAENLRRQVGQKRRQLDLRELTLLKQHFGMSIQALLRRMLDLGIISDNLYKEWCVNINRCGWRRNEPTPLPFERPEWLRRIALRAFAEQIITRGEAEKLLGETVEGTDPPELVERRAFLALPMDERRKILAREAADLKGYYQDNPEIRDIGEDDIVEYD